MTVALATVPAAGQGGRSGAVSGGDHIVAVVNQELVTAHELAERIAALRRNERSAGMSDSALRKQALDSLVAERIVVGHAREAGWRIDSADLDRAVQGVAAQNRMTVDELEQQLRAEGTDMARFRASLRDQIAVERTREQEVMARIVVSDSDVEREIAAQDAQAATQLQLDIAQILIEVPEGADAATVAAARARAEAALARVRAGEPFEQVAREVSQDANKAQGGAIGLRPAQRLPELFVAGVAKLAVGEVTPQALRSGAGWHLLKLLDRQSDGAGTVTRTHARHVILRVSDQLPAQQAAARLRQIKRDIEAGKRSFEDAAREFSEDGSAAQGGDLGWFLPGTMVPEFEEAVGKLEVGAISEPVLTRFGVHLIQVLERRQTQLDPKQRREQVRNMLRERDFARAYREWVEELRAKAFIDIRDSAAGVQ